MSDLGNMSITQTSFRMSRSSGQIYLYVLIIQFYSWSKHNLLRHAVVSNYGHGPLVPYERGTMYLSTMASFGGIILDKYNSSKGVLLRKMTIWIKDFPEKTFSLPQSIDAFRQRQSCRPKDHHVILYVAPMITPDQNIYP
jgi:hypothetical protein